MTGANLAGHTARDIKMVITATAVIFGTTAAATTEPIRFCSVIADNVAANGDMIDGHG